MNNPFRTPALLLLASLSLAHSSSAQEVKQVRLSRFTLQSTYLVKEKGQAISDPSWTPTGKWYPVTVPSTVLNALVVNKVYPDPYQGLNNMLIPDASDSFNRQYDLARFSHIPGVDNPWNKPYWYRTEFEVPAADKGRTFQLIFKGINYRAEVWLNGKRLADSSRMAGMFAQYSLDASSLIRAGGKNAMAVRIFPLDYPGLPAKPQLETLGDFYENGGPTGDIGKNVTMLCSVGWDWIPEVHDRNMGIWQPVYLRTSGGVTITDPQLVTRSADSTKALLSMALTLQNRDAMERKGTVTLTLTPESFNGKAITCSREYALAKGASTEVRFDPETVGEMIISQPRLWWPHGYGKADLYRVRITCNAGNLVTDDTSFLYGIRTVSSSVSYVNGWARRDFFVNNRKVHLNGGAWVPDMLLNTDSTRYDDELRLCRNANTNLVRIWGGGIAPPDVFFELCDRYGLLVWQDFWVTGDTQGEFKGSPDWPLEGNVFVFNMQNTILRIRNHPSLLVWTGGNEGHARKELYDAMRNSISGMDGTRPFIPSSSGFAKLPAGWKGSWPDDQPSGVYSGGSYTWQDASFYYKKVDEGKDWLFKDETGMPSQPTFYTLKDNIPKLEPDPKLPYPLNNTWGYHDACSGNGKYDIYYKAMVDRYGKPTTLKEFSDRMQLLNADGYRGIFESVGHKLNETGGVMLWKLNAAFPSVVWQIYDWYLEPNAGFYFMKTSLEPLHVQLNLDDSSVAVVNRTYGTSRVMDVEAILYDKKGKEVSRRTQKTVAAGTGVQSLFSLAADLASSTEIRYIMLTLKDGKQVISQNTYWLQAKQDYTAMKELGTAVVTAQVAGNSKDGTQASWRIRFTNTGRSLAFFLHPRLLLDGKEVRPSFWSANYFSLMPGQQREVELSVPARLLTGGKLSLATDGLNSPASTLAMTQ
jgi:hypothetical protein